MTLTVDRAMYISLNAFQCRKMFLAYVDKMHLNPKKATRVFDTNLVFLYKSKSNAKHIAGPHLYKETLDFL